MTDFSFDVSLRQIEPTTERMNRGDVIGVLHDARFICGTEEDNDVEKWYLTRGGQFIRETGDGGGRFYYKTPEEALEYLTGFAAEEALEDLRAAGAFRDAVYRGPALR